MTRGEPIRVVAPITLAVEEPELMKHARIDASTNPDMATLARLIAAATEHIENETGLGLITQTWEQTYPGFADPLILDRRPLQAVVGSPGSVSVVYLDEAGAEQELAPEFYRVTGVGSDRVPGSIRLAHGQAWPTTIASAEAVRIRYVVGFGDDPWSVPELLRQAIIVAATTWYDVRQDVIVGTSLIELPFASRQLVRRWRPLAVA